MARLLLELAGCLRKAKGRFYLTRKYRDLIRANGMKGLYPVLFDAFCQQYNWAYGDGYGELAMIQQSVLFTLYLLKTKGSDWRPFSDYEDDFLRAFPAVLEEAEASPFCTAEETIRACYRLRTLERFLVFLGLVEVQVMATDTPYNRRYRLRKTRLLDEVVRVVTHHDSSERRH